ncbi:hypothetical protein [Ktedonospora formicarum]|uniref:hypothetical protein n=1 Tax=Ktedonospora formicarum TaxID=2778364 RepID=UPI001C687ACD|nr:hypothetical protein [Ktedonospora formicarum]
MVYNQQTYSIQASADQNALALHKASSVDIPQRQMLALAFAGEYKTSTISGQFSLHRDLERSNLPDASAPTISLRGLPYEVIICSEHLADNTQEGR